MPINNDLPDKEFPMKWHYDEVPITAFFPALESIEVKLMDCPATHQLMYYAPQMGLATWEARPGRIYTDEEQRKFLHELFHLNVLPTVLETIGLTFRISNIDYIDVTHLIRHRTMSFSAHCTGDRDQRHDCALVKPSIEQSQFFEEYKQVIEDCKNLYAKMLDSKEISVLDARTILPRCLENHYYARVNLKDFIHFCRQRVDRQIQPESDNIIALRMLVEAVKVFPMLRGVVDLDMPDAWFVKTAQTDHSSNLYMPEIPRNDVFDYKPQWFVYDKQRENMLGGRVFETLWRQIRKEGNI